MLEFILWCLESEHFVLEIFLCRLFWYKVASFRYVSLVCPYFIVEFFEYSFHTDLPSINILAWCLAFYTLTWSIWNIRDVSFFSEKSFPSMHALNSFIIILFGGWKTRWGDATPSIADINRSPGILLLLLHGILLTIAYPGAHLRSELSRLTLMDHSLVITLKAGLKVFLAMLRELPSFILESW